MAPEQVEASRPYDPLKADVFQFGAMILRILTKATIFRENSFKD